MKCRHCGSEIKLPLVDLGSAPPSNAYLTAQTLRAPENWFPLRVLVCERCWLAQTEDYTEANKLFDAEYAYFSGFSSSWLAHCERYVADMVGRFKLKNDSHVIEVAANDGSLLQYVKARNIPCTGVEPTASTAATARAKGISIVQEFFGVRLAEELVSRGKAADLIVANNVLAHVPDINDFVAGFTRLLNPQGVATFEFPHLYNLVEQNQFDTIYHEHYSYLSLTAVERIFAANGLNVFDVEEIPTHGGSLRVFAQHADTGSHQKVDRLKTLRQKEMQAGMTTVAYYAGFQAKADRVKNDLLLFLLNAYGSRKSVAAYGAAAKGNTLLNYAGVRPDLLPYVVDKSPAKQGKFLPGSRIPITTEDHLRKHRADFVLILPWNLREEIVKQLTYIRDWGGHFVLAVPALEILD
jgi:predicted TPR repeat methyltransferase